MRYEARLVAREPPGPTCLAQVLTRKSRSDEAGVRGQFQQVPHVFVQRNALELSAQHCAGCEVVLTEQDCAVASSVQAELDPAYPGEERCCPQTPLRFRGLVGRR